MRAARLIQPDHMHLTEVSDPVPGPGDLVLSVEAATICGTDIRVFRGKKTAGIRYPSTIGHEFSGKVVAADPTSQFQPGQRVGVCPAIPCGHCHDCQRGRENLCPDLQAIGYEIDGAFADLIRIPARAIELGNVHALPAHLGFEEAALLEPLACVLNGQNKVALGLGDTVVVLGAGPIGLLHVKLARLRGAARVIVSEPNAARREAAVRAGADVAVYPTACDLHQRIFSETRGRGADVVICAIGIPSLATQAIGLAAMGGRVSLFAGFSKGEAATLDVNAIHYRELKVTGAFGLSRKDFADTLQMVAAGRIDLSDMITHRYELQDIQPAFAMAESGAAVKVAICRG